MMISIRSFWRFAAIAAALLFGLLTGCGFGPDVSEDFGQSARQTFQDQVINPDAPADPAPDEGIPGYVAGQIYNNRYVESLGGTSSGQ